MAQFEEYLEKKKQDDLIGFQVEEEQKLNLTKPQFEVGMDDEQLENYFNERRDRTTFRERSAYYFKDSRLLASKAKRYFAIGDGKGNVEEFASDHAYRSAKKRKKSADAAGKAFAKAAKLTNRYHGKKYKDHYELYERREEIMRLRLEGMLAAAEVKATSKENEIYRKCKARLSCLTVLHDQLFNLGGMARKIGDQKAVKKFSNRVRDIEKEIEETKLEMRQNFPSAEQAWKEANGFNGEVTKKEFRDAKKIVADITVRELIAQKMYKTMLTQNQGNTFPAQTVRLDRAGQPINAAEQRKLEWNERYRKAVGNNDEETKTRMTQEALDRIDRQYKFPDPETGNILESFKSNPGEMYEICFNAAPFLAEEKNKEGSPVQIRMQQDPVFRAKVALIEGLAKEMRTALRNAGIKPSDGKLSGEDLNEHEEEMPPLTTLYNDLFHAMNGKEAYWKEDIAKTLPTVDTKEQKKAKLKQTQEEVNENVTETEMKVLTEMSEAEKVQKNEEYRQIVANLHLEHDLSRTLGVMLRPVHFDKNGKPVSETDRKNKEQNDRWINAWVEKENETEEEKQKREDTKAEIVTRGMDHFFDGFEPFPEPEKLQAWLEKSLSERPFEFINLQSRATAFSEMAAVYPPMQQYHDTHPEFRKKLEILNTVTNNMMPYLNAYHGIKRVDGNLVLMEGGEQEYWRQQYEDNQDFETFREQYQGAYQNEALDPLIEEDKKKAETEKKRQKRELAKFQKKNPNFTQEDYRLYLAYNESIGMMTGDEVTASAERITEKLRGENPNAPRVDISRDYGSILKAVHYESGKPATMQDLLNEKYNKEWLKACEDGDMEKQQRMISAELPRMLEGVSFPKPENLEVWLQRMLAERPEKLFELVRKGLSIEGLKTRYPFVAEYENDHKEFRDRHEMLRSITLVLIPYMKKNHGLGIGSDSRKKAALLDQNSPEMQDQDMLEEQLSTMKSTYKEIYDRVMNDAG